MVRAHVVAPFTAEAKMTTFGWILVHYLLGASCVSVILLNVALIKYVAH